MSRRKRREGEHVPNGAYWPAGLDEAEYCRRCREPWPCSETTPAHIEAVADAAASSMRRENVALTYPKKLHDVVDALLDNGWNYMLNHGKDTGEHPFISVEARRGNLDVRVTWHTRATGTYRLFSCMVNKRDVTLTNALERIAA